MSVESKVIQVISEHLGVSVSIESTAESLLMDDIDQIDIMMFMEEEFDLELSDDEANSATTVRGIISLIEQKLNP